LPATAITGIVARKHIAGPSSMTPASPRLERPLTSILPLLAMLGLAGIALRIPILAVPPLLPLIRDDLRLSETEIGSLMGLPLALFALAAVPGSLLVARLGVRTTLLAGMVIAAVASGARGFAGGLLMLYLATILTGFGVSIMQPALPRLVRDWVPERIGLGTAMCTNGMLLGALIPIALTFPLVMPLVGNSWRLDLMVWAVPGLVIAAVLAVAFAAQPRRVQAREKLPERWWPDWRNPVTWLLGFTFGSNNSIYYASSSVLPDFLSHTGRSDLIGAALLWLNLGQIAALIMMLWLADRMLHRAWPFLVFGAMAVAGVCVVPFVDGIWVIVATAVVGLASAVTFAATLALPPALSRPDDVHRTAAGMFTIAYASAVFVPIISGALWDHSGEARLAFLPIAVCAVGLTVLGASLSRYRSGAASLARS
jgi:CP family cyanate transporter-like MFS transporter